MNIVERTIAELKPAEYNPRHKSEHVLKTVRSSLKEYGWLQPVVVNTHQCEHCGDRRNVIVGGHRRIEAAAANEEKTVPVVEVNFHLEDEKRANLRLNAQERFKKTDLAVLFEELHKLDAGKAAALGFSASDAVKLLYAARYAKDSLHGILAEKFLIPPFSIFDSRQGYWQQRKKAWKEIMGSLAETRETTLAKGENNLLMRGINEGTSTFDPVTAEVVYQWFTPEKGVILDPFAGEQTKAFVAAALGYDYHGVEIRPDQVETNKKALESAGLQATFYTGNSEDIGKLIPKDVKADLIFTSPPYYDLEIYSEGETDISAKQTYEEFMKSYENILAESVRFLKDNRFVILKIGDIRDEQGFYRNFLVKNIQIMERLGFKLYNEIIYIETTGTAPYRAERNMRKRKVVKTHQNLYSFFRGDLDKIKSPETIEVHKKMLAFLKGDPEKVQQEFKNPPPIKRDVFAVLNEANHENSQSQS